MAADGHLLYMLPGSLRNASRREPRCYRPAELTEGEYPILQFAMKPRDIAGILDALGAFMWPFEIAMV